MVLFIYRTSTLSTNSQRFQITDPDANRPLLSDKLPIFFELYRNKKEKKTYKKKTNRNKKKMYIY